MKVKLKLPHPYSRKVVEEIKKKKGLDVSPQTVRNNVSNANWEHYDAVLKVAEDYQKRLEQLSDKAQKLTKLEPKKSKILNLVPKPVQS